MTSEASSVHLFRGAPPVRSWSQHQQTVKTWTLCGIERGKYKPPPAAEDSASVTCCYCLDLMAPKSYDRKAKPATPPESTGSAARPDPREFPPPGLLLTRIATEHRVAIKRDDCGDPMIPGRYGHLYTDAGAILACFTGDTRDERAAKLFKTYRLQMLRRYLIKVKQEGDFEFVAEIGHSPEAIAMAFKVLHVRRFKVTKGISRPVPPQFRRPESPPNRLEPPPNPSPPQ
jgi:hypothetical protein